LKHTHREKPQKGKHSKPLLTKWAGKFVGVSAKEDWKDVVVGRERAHILRGEGGTGARAEIRDTFLWLFVPRYSRT